MSVPEIIEIVSEFYGIDAGSQSRKRTHIEPRLVAMFIARKRFPGMPDANIADSFGKERGSVRQAVSRITEMVSKDPEAEKRVNTLFRKVVEAEGGEVRGTFMVEVRV